MNKLILKSLLLIFVFIFSHSVMAQIDSTKTSLYLKCANEILIDYPNDIDTTKITFECTGGKIYQIISKKKIVVVPHSSTLSIDIFYNDKLFSSRKYTIKLVGKPNTIFITDKTSKDKFPRTLRLEITGYSSLFIQNCPLDANYRASFKTTLAKNKEVIISNLFTDQKTEIDEETWLQIKELVKKEPNENWRIIISVGGIERQDYKGEWGYGSCGLLQTYYYTLESFEE